MLISVRAEIACTFYRKVAKIFYLTFSAICYHCPNIRHYKIQMEGVSQSVNRKARSEIWISLPFSQFFAKISFGSLILDR